MVLLLELLKSNALPDLAIGGAWYGIFHAIQRRPGLSPAILENGLFELAVTCLNLIGRPADWIVSVPTPQYHCA